MMTARRSEHSVMFILYVILTIIYQVNTLQGDSAHPSERKTSTKFVDQGNRNLQHLNGAKRKYKWEMPHIWRDPEDFFIVDSFENQNYGSEKKLSNDQDYDSEKQSVTEAEEDLEKDLESLDSVLQQKKQEKMFESPVGYGMLVSGSDEDISSDQNEDTNVESDALKKFNEESGLPQAWPNFPKKINLYSWNSKKNISEGKNMKKLLEQNDIENNVEGINFKKANSDQLSLSDESKVLQSKKTINKNLDKNQKSRKSFVNDDSSAENIGYDTNKGQHENNKDNISPDLGKVSESRKHGDTNASPKGQNLINNKFGHDLKIQAWGYLNISRKDSTTAATLKTDEHESEETGIPPLQDILQENTEDSEKVADEFGTSHKDEEEKDDVSQNEDKIFGSDIEEHRGQELHTDKPEGEQETDSTEDKHHLVEQGLWYNIEENPTPEEDKKDKESKESDKVHGDDIWIDLQDKKEETTSSDDNKKEKENEEDEKKDDILLEDEKIKEDEKKDDILLEDQKIEEDDKKDPWFIHLEEEMLFPTEDSESSDVSHSDHEIADTHDPWISHHEEEDQSSKHELDEQGPDFSDHEQKKDIYADPWFGNISRPDDDQKKTGIDSRCLPCLNIRSTTNKAGCTLTLIQIHVICSQDETSMVTDSTHTKTCILEDNVEEELGDEKSLGVSLTDVSVDIWSSPAAYMIPSAWVHEFLLQDEALTENITYAKQKCESAQVVDWNCMYYELGGGDHSFSMSHLVNLFKRITNNKISKCLLNAVENCHGDWSVLRKETHDRIWLAEVQSEVLRYVESHQTSSHDTSSHHSSTEYNAMKNILFSIDHHLMPNIRNREEALKLQMIMSLQEKIISSLRSEQIYDSLKKNRCSTVPSLQYLQRKLVTYSYKYISMIEYLKNKACQPNVARKILQLL